MNCQILSLLFIDFLHTSALVKNKIQCVYLSMKYLIICIALIFQYQLRAQDSSEAKSFVLVDSSFVKELQQSKIGTASFYSNKFNGRKTSSGEIFSNDKLTAAHKTIKLGTYVKVRCLKNDSFVVVKVNDRLPQKSKRSIDLSTKAAKQLNFIKSGLTKVEITVLD